MTFAVDWALKPIIYLSIDAFIYNTNTSVIAIASLVLRDGWQRTDRWTETDRQFGSILIFSKS